MKQTIAYLPGSASVASNLTVASVSASAGDASLTATSALTYDAVGNLLITQGPLGAAQTTRYRYDVERQLVGVVAPNPGAGEGLPDPAVRYTYNLDGQPSLVESGTVTSQSDADWANFASHVSRAVTYDSTGRELSDLYAGAGVDTAQVQYAYDAAGRPQCTATRMNHSHFGSTATSACTPESSGASVPDSMGDQISYNAYDAADELIKVTTGYGTPAASDYLTQTWSANGQVLTMKDANGNLTTLVRDGFDRVSQVQFPLPTKGSNASSTTDYEAYGYDANGNLLTARRRSGETITLTYDGLNRLTEKAFPAGTEQNVFYGYDLLGRALFAHYGSLGGAGVDGAYDALGRLVSTTTSGRTLSYQYDLAGERTRITWPDAAPNALYVDYAYDLLGRATQIAENGAASGAGLLAAYTYDAFGNRTRIDRAGGAGASTIASYTRSDFVNGLTHNFAASANDVEFIHSYSHSPAPQQVGRTVTNDTYTYHPGTLSKSYVANGLNQYAKVGGATYAYDARGNLASDGTNAYTYDLENHLLTASGPTAVSLGYDPLGRPQSSNAGGPTTSFLYSGDDLVGEYDASGNILRRYVPGPEIDEPVVWYQGAGTATRRWLHADAQGSIIAWSDATGNWGATYGYGPYGEPDSWGFSASRYRYTGQISIPEAHLFFYKARLYSPALGRFLQTDPVGYASDVNAYAYVGNDPVNGTDPRGLEGQPDPNYRRIDYSPPTPVSEFDVFARALSPFSSADIAWLFNGGSLSLGMGDVSGGGSGQGKSGDRKNSTTCIGTGRGLRGNAALVGKQGGIPGQRVELGTAAVIPQQFGFSSGSALAPYAPYINGTIGSASFSSITDVMGGKSPISGVPVRQALQQMFPDQLILEIPGASDQGSHAPVVVSVPTGVNCPAGTSSSGG